MREAGEGEREDGVRALGKSGGRPGEGEGWGWWGQERHGQISGKGGWKGQEGGAGEVADGGQLEGILEAHDNQCSSCGKRKGWVAVAALGCSSYVC